LLSPYRYKDAAALRHHPATAPMTAIQTMPYFFCDFLTCRSGKAAEFDAGQTLPLGISDCRACVCRPASAGIAAFLTKI
jgi:hypothetical protein